MLSMQETNVLTIFRKRGGYAIAMTQEGDPLRRRLISGLVKTDNDIIDRIKEWLASQKVGMETLGKKGGT